MAHSRSPAEVYRELFVAVQGEHIFPDSKTFVDALPKIPPDDVCQHYMQQSKTPGFNLRKFVEEFFILPPAGELASATSRRPIKEQINLLWDELTRTADKEEAWSSLLSLPFPFVVPGGRFREIYYWDSYFTMLGLAQSGRVTLLEGMVKNFASLIDLVGFIPNGNRTYFCSRSQPPMFSMMVGLLAKLKSDKGVYATFFSAMQKEYLFWMQGESALINNADAQNRVVRCGNFVLNRYWDNSAEPRQESYAEDVETAQGSTRDHQELYRDIRAACESGWDFSSRWLKQPDELASIRTTRIVPVDLNCIMFQLENTLASTASQIGDVSLEHDYKQRAQARKHAIQSLFFDSKRQWFYDLVLDDFLPSDATTLAGVYPLFFKLATEAQAQAVHSRLIETFLCSGGWVTTTTHSAQQWDAPNGWAPLQWIVFKGLRHYGYDRSAVEGASRWLENCQHVYRDTGKLLEKYNVEDIGLIAEGGEYNVQDGFGWTNGVLLCLMDELEKAASVSKSLR